MSAQILIFPMHRARPHNCRRCNTALARPGLCDWCEIVEDCEATDAEPAMQLGHAMHEAVARGFRYVEPCGNPSCKSVLRHGDWCAVDIETGRAICRGCAVTEGAGA